MSKDIHMTPFKKLSITLVTSILSGMLCLSVFAEEQAYEGSLVVVNKRADSVTFIDLDKRKAVTEVATGKGPHEVAVTKDGALAVVTDYVGGNSLSIYEVATAKKVREISLAEYPRPHGVLFMEDQKRVAVSAEGADAVVIADVVKGEITQTIATEQKGSHMVALPSSSQRIYTTNMGSNTVSELDVETSRVLRQIPMPETPEAVTINQSGTELWVGSNKDGWVTVYDLWTRKPLKRWEGFSFPYRILLTKDERYAVVPDFRNDTLDIFDAVKKERIKQISFDKGTTPNGVIFYTDDRTLFMSAYNKNKVLAIRIPTGEILFEIETGDGPDGIGYSALSIKPESCGSDC